MTLKLARRLLTRQAAKMPKRTFALLVKQKPGLNFNLVKEIFLHTPNMETFSSTLYYFSQSMAKGNKRVMGFLNRTASEKITPDAGQRQRAINALTSFANWGEKRAWRGLFLATRDSKAENRWYAYGGVQRLAEDGNSQAVEILIRGLNDPVKKNSNRAQEGLEQLSEQGNVSAQKFLQKQKERKR